MLAGSTLSSIESKICQGIINNSISHENFTTIINKEISYRELKGITRMTNNQRSNAEKINLIEEDKK